MEKQAPLKKSDRNPSLLQFASITICVLLLVSWMVFSRSDWYLINHKVPQSLEALIENQLEPYQQQDVLEKLAKFDYEYVGEIAAQITHPEVKGAAYFFSVVNGTDTLLMDSLQSIPKMVMESAGKVSSRRDRIYAFHHIYKAAMQVKDTAVAAKSLKDALIASIKLEEVKDRVGYISSIAELMEQVAPSAKAQRFLQQSLAEVNKLNNPEDHGYTRYLITLAATHNRNPQQAKDYLKQAFELAHHKDYFQSYSFPFCEAAKSAARMGDTAFAHIALQKAKVKAGNRVDALAKIAETAGFIGDTAAAIINLQQAFMAEFHPPRSYRHLHFARLGGLAVAFGDSITLQKVLEEMELNVRLNDFIEIAKTATQIGDTTNALTFLAAGVKATGKLEPNNYQFLNILSLVEAAAQLGDTALAATCIQQFASKATGSYRLIYDHEPLNNYTRRTAQLLGTSQALSYLGQIAADVSEIEDSDSKIEFFIGLSHSAALIKDTLQAHIYLQEALSTAEKMEEASDQASIFCSIAEAAGNIGDATIADACCRLAITVTKKISEPENLAKVYARIAKEEARIGDSANATTHFNQAITVALKIENDSSQLRSLHYINFSIGLFGPSQPLSRIVNYLPAIKEPNYQLFLSEAVISAYTNLGESRKAYNLANELLSNRPDLKAWCYLNLLISDKGGFPQTRPQERVENYWDPSW